MSVDNVTIDPEELGTVIAEMMEEYGVETRARIAEVTKEVTKDAKNIVKANANVEMGNRFPYRKGKYKRSIRYRMKETSLSDIGIVYASGHEYSLTHLLENGHKLWQAPGKRTRAFKHWKKGEELAQQEFVPKMIKKLSK